MKRRRGKATVVTDDETKQRAFRAFLEHLLPGRWEDSRQPDAKESGATIVLAVPIDEASVKVPVEATEEKAADAFAYASNPAAAGKVAEKGLTVVPLSMALVGNWIKVEIALVRGKQLHDKRETLRRRTLDREAEQAIKDHNRRN